MPNPGTINNDGIGQVQNLELIPMSKKREIKSINDDISESYTKNNGQLIKLKNCDENPLIPHIHEALAG